jgi:hypothetical protein
MRILVLDDEQERHEGFARRFKGHDVYHVYTYAQACAALANNFRFDLAQLDHDLCDFWQDPETGCTYERTGEDVTKYIIDYIPEGLRPKRVVVHSWNPGGAQRMLELFRDAGVPAVRDAYRAV